MLEKKKIAGYVVMAVVLGLLLARYLERVPKRHYCDFRVYHHAAQVFLAGKNIYLQDSPAITPFKYSPFFAFLISPLGFLPIKAAAALFFIINFLATISFFRSAGELIVRRALTPPQRFLLYALSAAFVFKYLLATWDSGQVVIIMCALVAGALYCLSRGSQVRAAALLAAAIMIKYTPAVFIPYLIVRKKYKAAVWCALFILAALFIPALSVGLRKNYELLASWIPSIVHNSLDNGSYYDFMNQSFFSFILRFTSPSPYAVNVIDLSFRTSMAFAYILSLAIYLAILVPRKQRDTARLDYALLFIGIPLFNPNGWVLSFVALAFPFMCLSYYLALVRSRDVPVFICVVAAFVAGGWMGQSVVGERIAHWAEILSCTTISALILMAGLLRLKFSRADRFSQLEV